MFNSIYAYNIHSRISKLLNFPFLGEGFSGERRGSGGAPRYAVPDGPYISHPHPLPPDHVGTLTGGDPQGCDSQGCEPWREQHSDRGSHHGAPVSPRHRDQPRTDLAERTSTKIRSEFIVVVFLLLQQGPQCTGTTGKKAKCICQGKHRDFGNFAKKQGNIGDLV